MASKWRLVRLELGRTAEFPSGSPSRAYFVQLPLDECGEVDEEAFSKGSTRATYRRHWASDPDEIGQIRKLGRNLVLGGEDKPDRILEVDGWPLRPGQQIGLMEDGDALPLKVVSVS